MVQTHKEVVQRESSKGRMESSSREQVVHLQRVRRGMERRERAMGLWS